MKTKTKSKAKAKPSMKPDPTVWMDSNERYRLGRKVCTIREKLKMSQEELAHRISCTQPTIHNYEKGLHRITDTTLDSIRVATGTVGVPLSDKEVVEFKRDQYLWNRTANYEAMEPEQVEEKLRELLHCAKWCSDEDLEIFCTLFAAVYYFNTNRDGECRDLIDSLKRKVKKFTNEHRYWYHWCLGCVAYWSDGWHYSVALPHFLDAMKYGRRLGLDLGLDFKVLHYNIGSCYSEMDYHYPASEYLENVKTTFFESFNATMAIAIQRYLAVGCGKFTRTKTALELLENCRAYVVKERKDDKLTLGGIYRDIGRVYQDAGDYEKALEYFNMASQQFDKTSEAYLECLCYKASLLRAHNKLDMLHECLDEGLSMATKDTLWYEWLNMIKHSTTIEQEPSFKYLKWTSIPRLREYGRHLLVMECYTWLSDYSHSIQHYKSAFKYNHEASSIYIKLMKGDLTLCKKA